MEFTSDDWVALKSAPLLVFQSVAQADNEIDAAEVDQLITRLGNPAQYQSAIFTQAVTELMAEPDVVATIGSRLLNLSDEGIDDQVSQLKEILDNKADAQASLAFKQALIRFGTDIAIASGEQDMPISKLEWAEVAHFKKLLGL